MNVLTGACICDDMGPCSCSRCRHGTLMRFNSSGVMDWPGQKSEQNALQCCLVGAAAAATITWLLSQSTKAMLATYLVGVIVTFLVAVPDWDFFRRPCSDWHDVVFVGASAHVVREIAEQRDRKWLTKISAVNTGSGTTAFDDKKLT